MRAFVLTAPHQGGVREVCEPVPATGEAVVDVELCGVCGTDVEFFTGEMAYLHDGHAAYPMRLGHEWAGTVSAVGPGTDPVWVGRRVMGDTMLGCGACDRCARGRAHVCERRQEVGIRGGRAGALAERLAVPASSLHALPEAVDSELGALVEPGGSALRAARACAVGAGRAEAGGARVLVIGPGTIGLLCAMFLRAEGVAVTLFGLTRESMQFALELGFSCWWTAPTHQRFDAVINATPDPNAPAGATALVEPGGRVVFVGVAGDPSPIDSRSLVFGDVTAVGILSASPGLHETIAAYASGAVDPRPLVAATVGLDQVGAVLSGTRPAGAGPGPKVLVDPRA